jgi:hypothetical protein
MMISARFQAFQHSCRHHVQPWTMLHVTPGKSLRKQPASLLTARTVATEKILLVRRNCALLRVWG